MTAYVIIIAAVILLDQISKYIIQNDISLYQVEIIPGFFDITYARNTGMAWSLLSGKQVFLSLVSAAAILCMVWYLSQKKPNALVSAGLSLMIGGAAGNLIDRLFFGYVRDFLNFYIFGYDFPIFNIADAALCIGVFLLLIDAFREDRKDHGNHHD